jgi:hypothetical protein
MRFLTVEIDGKEIEIIDFLERFQMEFDKLIEDAEKNYMNKEYMYFV